MSIATAAVLALAGPAFACLDDGIVPDGTNPALEAAPRCGPTVTAVSSSVLLSVLSSDNGGTPGRCPKTPAVLALVGALLFGVLLG